MEWDNRTELLVNFSELLFAILSNKEHLDSINNFDNKNFQQM